MTRDDLRRRAVRLLGEYHRTLKQCLAAQGEERRLLAAACSEKARDAQAAVNALRGAGALTMRILNWFHRWRFQHRQLRHKARLRKMRVVNTSRIEPRCIVRNLREPNR